MCFHLGPINIQLSIFMWWLRVYFCSYKRNLSLLYLKESNILSLTLAYSHSIYWKYRKSILMTHRNKIIHINQNYYHFYRYLNFPVWPQTMPLCWPQYSSSTICKSIPNHNEFNCIDRHPSLFLFKTLTEDISSISLWLIIHQLRTFKVVVSSKYLKGRLPTSAYLNTVYTLEHSFEFSN